MGGEKINRGEKAGQSVETCNFNTPEDSGGGTTKKGARKLERGREIPEVYPNPVGEVPARERRRDFKSRKGGRTPWDGSDVKPGRR